ncbi:hypothetical protein J2X76_003623 [Neorhizobium sp. 2083]|uniref:hypothetical protein n=1 Tax=Neorhizobium sp. 2083 TaxID=2817762 RepID=UPI0028669E6B|nr:hypothetical protein [Neorhizobium sp. 2083]MDR6818446.1 hypothetical protein [Neorhizobium sp. 2083]
MLSRRAFLTSTAAVAIAPLLPAVQSVAAEATLIRPATTIWVGGHRGEYDWQPFHGETKRDVIRQLLEHHSHGNDEEIDATMTMTDEELDVELKAMEMSLQRVSKMDGLQPDEIRGHHWIRAGLGSCCDRCDSETCADMGARALNGEAVCEECLTFRDKIQLGDYEDEIEEELVELLTDHDLNEAEVFQVLAMRGDETAVSPALWAKCLVEARKWA